MALGIKTLSGFKRKATKLGVIATAHSQLNEGETEYWPWPVAGSEIPNWPSERYPMLFYTSSDHSTGDGGIHLRVWDRNVGELYTEVDGVRKANPDALVEWQTISNRTEFNHITRKTSPIFSSSGNGTQTETPSVMVVDGVVYLYCHDSGVNVGVGITVQTTKRASGNNGVDFGSETIADFWYDPSKIEGDGHTGYITIGANTIESFPYNYIAKGLHGGARLNDGSTEAIWGSNDGINWNYYAIAPFQYGMLNDDVNFADGKVLSLSSIHEAKKEGAYWRVLGHHRLAASGGASTQGDIVEVLLDQDLKVVSYKSTVLGKGSQGEFDEESVGSSLNEITIDGETYGFYVAIDGAGNRAIAMYITEPEPHEWEIFSTLADKTTQFESATTDAEIAQGFTFSHAATNVLDAPNNAPEPEIYRLTKMTLPMDATESTAESVASVSLSGSEVIDVVFDRIGRGDTNQIIEFGIIDLLDSPTSKISCQFHRDNPKNYNTQPMRLLVLGANDETEKNTGKFFGQKWMSGGSKEDTRSKHVTGFRIIPSESRLLVIAGSGLLDSYDISGFDFTKSYKIFIKGRLESAATEDGDFGFNGVSVTSYSNNSIAVPSAPTLTTSKSSDTITLSTNNVSGATGYKYFLDNQSNETGVFENLEPETEYTVYARAVNALGDSEPSTIQTVTTDAAQQVNQPPVANAGPDQSVAAGVLVQVSASGSSDGDGTIVGYKWRETTNSGITLSNTTAEDISFTSPVSGTAQTVTLELIVTDDDGVDSAPVYVDIDVAAEVDTTPPVIILTGGNIALNVGEVFQEPGYQAFNNKGADITDQVTVTGSTSTAFPRTGTLEYNVVVDGIAAETQTRIFTVTAESELLEAVSKQKFLRDNTVISAFTGRSNIEELKFQLASTNTKIALDNQGYYDFDENETQKIIVVTEDGEISSENGDVEWKGSSLFVRFGAISSRKSQLSARVVVFLAGDERGLVIAGPGLNANLLVKFN
jgi:hypothetical protein